MAHKDEIRHQIMKTMKPAIVMLLETGITNEIKDSELNITRYNIITCDAENTRGIALYIRGDIKYEIIILKKIEANYWCVAIEIKLEIYKGIIMVMYHSPSASHGEFIKFLEEIVEELMIKNEYMIIRDFNIDCMADSFMQINF